MKRPRLAEGTRLQYDDVRQEHLLLIPEGSARGCVSPRSIASSWAQSTSVLNLRAATARSCCSLVRQRSTTSRSA